MSASSDLQAAIEGLLSVPGALRVVVPIVKRRAKELANEIQAAGANHGLCIFVMPPLPTSVQEGLPFVFFDKAEIRVRIIEKPSVNKTGSDAYDLVDDIATALHWAPHRGITEATTARQEDEPTENSAAALVWVMAQPVYAPLFAINAILAHPLELAPRPTDLVEDPQTRIIDVVFNAVYQLNPTAP